MIPGAILTTARALPWKWIGIGALIAWIMIVTGQRNAAVEQVKSESLAHAITLQSVKDLTASLKDQNEKIREIDRLGQERSRNAAAALKDARREADKLRGPLEALRASAAVPRNPGAPCVPSAAVRAVEGRI